MNKPVPTLDFFLDSPAEQVKNLLALNEVSAAAGLSLTPEEAALVVAENTQALADHGRIAWDDALLEKFVRRFADSAAVSNHNYAELLRVACEAYYYLLDEADDRIHEDEAVAAIVAAIDKGCTTAQEILANRGVAALARVRSRRREI